MLRTMDLPTNATFRWYTAAVSRICCTRWTWLAKHATMIRCVADAKISASTGAISRSLVTMPGISAFVESDISRSTPSSPSRAKPPRSVSRRSSGSWSILKSPVCRTTPALVLIATASASGIEWFTAKNSMSNGPNDCRAPAPTSTVCGVIRCSASFPWIRPSVSLEPTSGISRRSRSRYGMPPIWSSCAWVITMASMRPNRSSRLEKSGRTRSTPGWSGSGNSTPQSTTSRRPRCSKTVMLRPISPRPPRPTRRSPLRASGGGGLRFGCG